uniref:Uncharacterized protein n=1 Tax=Nelumbo nucifera TaxID=4432 RepID=A0A822ZND2_NELNU|nr:TPA_asm: hypothetical protein HUJ06_016669 [Nelumbo nucifera]
MKREREKGAVWHLPTVDLSEAREREKVSGGE